MAVIENSTAKYENGRNVLALTEKVKELIEEKLPSSVSKFLEDKFLICYRNNNNQWSTWKYYKTDFSVRFLAELKAYN